MKKSIYTHFFEAIRKTDVGLAGGKGASLGEMTQAGISVPPGFVVTAQAFEEFLKATDLNVELDAVLDQVDHTVMHTIDAASEKIKALILGAEMPKAIAVEIQQSFKKLGAKYVAVRSSATSEDSADAAWAGQLESYLNTTEDKVLENVKKCWASLFTPRVIFYRFEKGLHGKPISVAVVIQKMIQSEVSGIAFSVHPVTQDYDQLIIEAGFGLGEAIVSGSITPDSFVVEKSSWKLLDKNITTQERGLFRKEGGENEWKDIPTDKGERPTLMDNEVIELAKLVVKIEKHYGFPVDVEWAREAGEFCIVQSRPITTLAQNITLNSLETRWHTFRSRYIPAVLPILYYWSWSLKDEIGVEAGTLVNVWDRGNYQAIWEERGYQQVRDYAVKYLLSEINALDKVRKRGLDTGQVVVDLCKQFSTEASTATYAQFANFLSQLATTYNNFTKHSMVLWLFTGEAIQERIQVELKNLTEDERNQIFSILSIPAEKSYSQEEEEKFEEIVAEAKVKGIDHPVVKKVIKQFSDRYFWFPYEYIGPAIWNYEAVHGRVLESMKESTQKSSSPRKAHDKDSLKVSSLVSDLFKVLRLVTLMQDDRKMLNAQICYYLNHEILGALAQKTGVELEKMRYLENHLLQQLATGKIDEAKMRSELQERSDYCVITQEGKKISVYAGRAAKEKLTELGIEDEKK